VLPLECFVDSEGPLFPLLRSTLHLIEPAVSHLRLSVAHLLVCQRCSRIPSLLIPSVLYIMGLIPIPSDSDGSGSDPDDSHSPIDFAVDHIHRWRSILKPKDEVRLCKYYGIPTSVKIRFPEPRTGCVASDKIREVCLYEHFLKVGFRFPFPPIVRKLLCYLDLSPAQIKPNGWRYLLGCCILWLYIFGDGVALLVREFLNVYQPVKYGDWMWTFQSRDNKIIHLSSSYSNKQWEYRLFMVSGGLDASESDDGDESVFHNQISYAWKSPADNCRSS
jgi:hypothetical protein